MRSCVHPAPKFSFSLVGMIDNVRRPEEIAAENCLTLIQQYAWLLNSFVVEFYTENHWEKLPSTWRDVLSHVPLDELGEWMSMTERTTHRVWPLSLLAFRASAKAHSLSRKPATVFRKQKLSDESLSLAQVHLSSNKAGVETECLTNHDLKNLFLRHVKPKKRHETFIMAKLCADAAVQNGVNCIVDLGAGKGHLSRILAFGYRLNVHCIEAQSDLIASARNIDQQILTTASKHLGNSYVNCLPCPEYLEMTVGNTDDAIIQFKEKLLPGLKKHCGNTLSFGIVGLHPCGDLAATLLKIFTNLNEAKFICIASCCYMKLSMRSHDKFSGYPLSKYFLNLPNSLTHLTYEALEVSCHALEAYCQRLRQQNYEVLKIHCFRAVLEKLIIKHRPDLKRAGLRGVKHFDEMEFPIYAAKALDRVGVQIPLSDLSSSETAQLLKRWQDVVVIYSLRLLLAPLVETAIILDRLLFIQEQGGSCSVIPGFDPVLSPRNLILQGSKT